MAGAHGDFKVGGYCVLHGDGVDRLADALRHRTPAPLQLDLLIPPRSPEKAARASSRIVTEAPVLEHVRPRSPEHLPVFEAVRLWAYRERRGACLDAWTARVMARAEAERDRSPTLDGFPAAEARTVGYSVAVGVWTQGPPDPEAQRRRGVKRHYGDAKADTVDRVKDRHARLRADLASGMATKAAARAHGYHPKTVFHLRRRWGLDFTRELLGAVANQCGGGTGTGCRVPGSPAGGPGWVGGGR